MSSKMKKTIRYIEGEYYICWDVGCPDLTAAQANRQRIKEGFATEWWRRMEYVRDHSAHLPSWIPVAKSLNEDEQ